MGMTLNLAMWLIAICAGPAFTMDYTAQDDENINESALAFSRERPRSVFQLS